jgi:tellurite resistance protein
MASLNTTKTPTSSDLFSRQEAFMGVALAASASDGTIDDSEVNSIFNHLIQMRIFDGYTERQITDIFKKLLVVLENEGIRGLVIIAKNNLPIELRETAYAYAVEIAFVSGMMDDNERALLEELQQALEISDQIGGMILEVMMIKSCR